MKTLALLSLLALLAFLAQADPLPEATEEAKNEEQSEVEDQDVSISFSDSASQIAASRSAKCTCRRFFCWFWEQNCGSCQKGPLYYIYCCR